MAAAETPLPQIDRSSLSDRAFTALVKAIHRGYFAGGRMPSEPELARQLAVSRATLRSALASLEHLGLVRRRPGSGTWLRPQVTAHVLALHGLVPWAVVLGLSHEVTSTAELRSVDDAGPLRTSPAQEQPSMVYRIDRTLLADGAPAVLISELVPAAVLVKPLSEPDLEDSILTVSLRSFRIPIEHTVAALVPTCADQRIAELFAVPPGTAYLVLHETFHSDADEPLASATVSLHPSFIQLGVFRRTLK